MMNKYFAALLALVLGPLAPSALFAAESATASHPDLSGVWQIASTPKALVNASGADIPLLPEAKDQYQKNKSLQTKKKADAEGDPSDRCLPPGVPRLFLENMPFKIQQQAQVIAMIFQWNHLYRLVYLDTDHFEQIAPAYLGQSIGKWEGNSLVVDTNGFNAQTWLDNSGLPHSDALHITERFSLTDGGKTLENRITIDDPQTFSKPWETLLRFQRKAGDVRDDDYCLGRIGKEPMNLK